MTGDGEREVGDEPPRAVTHLQLDVSDSGITAVPESVFTDLADAGLDDQERGLVDEARSKRHRRFEDRYLNDFEFIEKLRTENFTGPRYEVLRAELAAYGLPVLSAWMRSGRIFAELAKLGRPVTADDQDRARLQEDGTERWSLAQETAAHGLTYFHKVALVGRKWSPLCGASLPTYFVGACLHVFPNIYRKWRVEALKWRKTLCHGHGEPEVEHRPLQHDAGTDPAVVVGDKQVLATALQDMPANLREIVVRLLLTDEDFKQIGGHVGISDRAVEGRLFRYRDKHDGNEWRQG